MAREYVRIGREAIIMALLGEQSDRVLRHKKRA